MSTKGYESFTASDAARLNASKRGAPATPKQSKYRNVKVTIDNHRFDSKREAAIYQELKLREKAGEIRELRLQVPFDLMTPDVHTGAYVNVAQYIADFAFRERDALQPPDAAIETWHLVLADCKGGRTTAMFNLKKKWLFLQSGIEIRELR